MAQRKYGAYRYTPRGTTWNPCPACGEEPKSSYRTGGICEDCQNLFEWAKHERERFAKLQGLEIRTLAGGPTRLPIPFCPGGTSPQTPHYQEFEAARQQLGESVYVLLELLAVVTGGAAEIQHHQKWDRRSYSINAIPRGTDSTWHKQEKHRKMLIRPDDSRAIDQLLPQLQIMIRCAYAAGLHDGKSLLNQLARGDITLDSLAEADARAAKGIQESLERANRTNRE